MKAAYDLSDLTWSLTGWHPNAWRGQTSSEFGLSLKADVGPIPARVPGSVQKALLDAGLLPDWNVGLASRECEWVENRHWVFETKIPTEWTAGAGSDGGKPTGRVFLRCDGLDYQGEILVNGEEAGSFRGTFVPHSFDLTPFIAGKEVEDTGIRLAVVFTDNPRSLGQSGYTSRITEWKARFHYGWDWTPRLVQVGVWDGIRLEVRRGDTIDSVSLHTEYDHGAKRGTVALRAGLELEAGTLLQMILECPEGEVRRESFPATAEYTGRLGDLPVEPWHPNGGGGRALYGLRVRLLDADGSLLDEETRRVGFREIVWKQCRDAPAGAEPWVCCVNGIDTFLQGVNWTPIRPNFADVTDADCRLRLEAYRDMGCNLVRVWGGAVLEKEGFYDLCDELGLMVWQEFPLSSSGIDNWPPENEQAIQDMKQIAASYVTRRRHHASLLLWCGGNELQGGPGGAKLGIGRPVDATHPMMAMLKELVHELDAPRRFLPTSSSGPRFMASEEEYGQGLHHDVHGPWDTKGSLDGWRSYWGGDDSLFRSETGMPGASPANLISRYGGDMALPADYTSPFWKHTGGWWIQWEDYLADGGSSEDLNAFVAWSQTRQAEALSVAARACKGRFPACGGIVLWMGHDSYPCPANTSVLDFLGRPKPAADAVGVVFRS